MWFFLPIVLLLHVSAVIADTIPAVEEDELKAAFLFNFARYTRWPSKAAELDDGNCYVCFYRAERGAAAFSSVAQGATIMQKKVVVSAVSTPDELGRCDLIYTDEPGPPLATAENQPIPNWLTVGDGREFVERGGVIALHRHDDHLRFMVNQSAARRAGLVLSSKLLRLATEVLSE